MEESHRCRREISKWGPVYLLYPVGSSAFVVISGELLLYVGGGDGGGGGGNRKAHTREL